MFLVYPPVCPEQHLDSDRSARTRQPPSPVPGEVQICRQVRPRPPVATVATVITAASVIHLPFLRRSRGIVFVVDSAIFQKEVRDVAEFLYVLLTDAVIARNAPALIVACNKQGNSFPLSLPCVPAAIITHRCVCPADVTMAKSAKLIQQQLEKEL